MTKYEVHDVVAKYIAAALTAISLVSSVWIFTASTNSQLKTEYNKILWQEDRRILQRLAESAAHLAASSDSPKLFDDAKARFLSTYYGELPTRESPTLEAALKELRVTIEAYNEKAASSEDLKQAVMKVTDECRATVIEQAKTLQ